jgi:hypothetical protein
MYEKPWNKVRSCTEHLQPCGTIRAVLNAEGKAQTRLIPNLQKSPASQQLLAINR